MTSHNCGVENQHADLLKAERNYCVIENTFGILVSPGAHRIRRNTVTGQLEEGIGVASSGAGAYGRLLLTGNNLVGNGVRGSSCGIATAHLEPIVVERNSWGRATGPGPDPGDEACGDFDTVPFAPRPIPIVNSAGT